MRICVAVLVCLLAPLAAEAQLPGAGRLLVSTPALGDPEFDTTIVLLVHHSEEGSFGLFLNRPTWVDGGDAFAVLEDFDAAIRTLDFGGPVAITQLLALVSDPGNARNATEVTAGVYLTADIAAFAAAPPGDIRVFAGHTVWGPDQLQREIDDGYWRLVEGSADLVFDTDTADLWERVSELAAGGLTAARSGER